MLCSCCQCGTSSHKLFTISDYNLKGFLSLTTNKILPRLNMSITLMVLLLCINFLSLMPIAINYTKKTRTLRKIEKKLKMMSIICIV